MKSPDSPLSGSNELVDFVLVITWLPTLCVLAVLIATGTTLTGTLGYFAWLGGAALYAGAGCWLALRILPR